MALVRSTSNNPWVNNVTEADAAEMNALGDAINGKIDTAMKNVANGVPGLNATGVISPAQLPAYVDDVLEYANLAAFPGTGTTGVIYIALSPSGKQYRWSGSTYVEMISSPGTTDTLTEGTTNLYFTNARADARIAATAPELIRDTMGTALVPGSGVTINPSDAGDTITISASGSGSGGGSSVDTIDGSAITTSTALQAALVTGAADGRKVALKPGQLITFPAGASGITVPAYGGMVCNTHAEWKYGAPSSLLPRFVAQTGMTGPMVTTDNAAQGIVLKGFNIDANNVTGVTRGLFFSNSGSDVENSHHIEDVSVRRVINGIGITGRLRTSLFKNVNVFECLSGVAIGANGAWFDCHWDRGYIALCRNVGVSAVADASGNSSQMLEFYGVRVERTGQLANDPKNATTSANWNNTAPGWLINAANKWMLTACTSDANNGPAVKILIPGAGLGYRISQLLFNGCIFNRDGQFSGIASGSQPGISVLGFSSAGADHCSEIRFDNCLVNIGESADDGSSTYEAPYYGVEVDHADFFVWHGSAKGTNASFNTLTNDLWQPEIADQYSQTFRGTGYSAAKITGLATVATTGNYSDLIGAPAPGGGGSSGGAGGPESLATGITVTVVPNSFASTITAGVKFAAMTTQPELIGLIGTTATNMVTVSSVFKGPGWKDDYTAGTIGAVLSAPWAVSIWTVSTRYVEFVVGRVDYTAVSQCAYRVWVDDRKVTNLPVVTGLGNSGTASTIKIDFGAGNNGVHKVRLEMSALLLESIFVEQLGSVWAAQPIGPRVFCLGSSLTQGATAVAANTGFELGTWLHRFANLVGIQDFWNGGEAGTGPNTTSGGYANYKTRATTQVIPAAPDVVIIDGYFNDFGAGRTGAQISADITTTMNTIKAGLPEVKIIVMGGVDPTGTTNTVAMVAIDVLVKAACATAGAAFVSGVSGEIVGFDGTVLSDTNQWITTVNKGVYINLIDNLHPSDDGQAYIAYLMFNAWNMIWDREADIIGDGGPRVVNGTSTATPSINMAITDVFVIPALAVNITGVTLTNTAAILPEQPFRMVITPTATRTLAWGSQFEGALLPTSAPGTARLDVDFVWNSATLKMKCMRVV